MTRFGEIYLVSTVTLRTSRIQAKHPPHPLPWTKPTRNAPPNGLKAATGLVYITYIYLYNMCIFRLLYVVYIIVCPPNGLKAATGLVCFMCVHTYIRLMGFAYVHTYVHTHTHTHICMCVLCVYHVCLCVCMVFIRIMYVYSPKAVIGLVYSK